MRDRQNSVEDLIKALFYEAGIRTGKPDTKNAMAEDISRWLQNVRGFNVSVRTLTRQYDRYISQSEDAQGAAPSAEVQDEYAKYLGYKNYSDFIVKTNNQNGGEETGSANLPFESPSELSYIQTNNHTTFHGNQNHFENEGDVNYKEGDVTIIEEENEKSKKRNNRILYIVIFTAIVVSIILWLIYAKNNERLCLFWKTDHFESASCKDASEDEKELMISPQEWQDKYKNFRKIQPNENSRFFDSNGKPVVWYQYKNGEYEFFNQSGSHPLNGEKLLPVNAGVVEAYMKSIEAPEKTPEDDESFTSPEAFNDDPVKSDDTQETAEIEAAKGKYCFKNESDKPLVTYIQSAQKPNQRIDLQPNEQACVLLPIDNYSYSTYINGQVLAIKHGKFTVSENKEGYMSLSLPEEETAIKEVTTPEIKPAKDCSKGDFCVRNTTNKTLTFRLKHNGSGTFSPSQNTSLTIHSGKTECFYDLPAAPYSVEYNFGILTVTNMQHTNIRVVGCETGEKVF